MKRYLFIMLMVAALIVFGVAGCRPDEDDFDEAALVAVNDYIEEVSKALLDALPDLLGWVREPYSDNLPLRYSEERQELLQKHQDILGEVRKRHLNVDFPTIEEMTRWNVVAVRGDQEWLLEGPVLTDALVNLEELTVDLIGTIEMVIESDGKLDLTQSEQVLKLIDRIEPEIEEVRYVLFR